MQEHEGPLDLRARLIRSVGLLSLLVLLVSLFRFTLPQAPYLPPILVLAALLWFLPWHRLPEATLLPFSLAGAGCTALLIYYGQYSAFYGLFFLWIVFGAIAYAFPLGLLHTLAIALLSLGVAYTTGSREIILDHFLVLLPSYLIFYFVARQIVRKLFTLLSSTSNARSTASRVAALYDLSTLLSGERDLDRLLDALVRGLATNFDYRYVSVFLLDEGRLRLRAQVGYTTPVSELALNEGITGLVAQEGEARLVSRATDHPHFLVAEPQIGSQVSVPLLYAGRVLGVLNIEGGPSELTEDDLRLLETLAAPTAAAIENATLVSRLEDQAHRDPLTCLLNRRGITTVLEAVLPRQGHRAVEGQPVTILLVDLNGFKSVNDRYGHAVGDMLLVDLAQILATSVRAGDSVGRLGGDEFLIVMPGAGSDAATHLVERLAARIANYSFPVLTEPDTSPPPQIGYSLGMATAPEDGHDAETLLAVADRAMYRAKRGLSAPIRFLKRDRAGATTSAD